MGFILFLVAFTLIVLLVPVGFLFMTFISCLSLNKSYVNDYWRKLAISLDQFGNVAMSGLFNVILIKPIQFPFGDPDETISSVIGKNKEIKSLTWLGRKLDNLLEFFDKGHSIKSIEK